MDAPRTPPVRYDDSTRFQPESGGEARGIDYERGPVARDSGDGATTSDERIWRPSTVIDLGHAARRAPVPVPRLSGSVDRNRLAPAAARTASIPEGAWRRDASLQVLPDNARALGAARARLREQPIDRNSILDRYRDSGNRSVDRPVPSTRANGSRETGLSARRGAITPSSGEVARSRSGLRSPTSPNGGRRSASSNDSSTRTIRERQGVRRLQDLQTKSPDRARDLIRQGEMISVATHTGVQIGIGATLASCGVSGGCTFSDPCNGPSTCSPSAGWCSPYSWWWWNGLSYGFPGWGFSACYGGFGFWWGSSYCSYPYASYYCPSPVYYSYLIYDTVEPQPIYQEVAAEEPYAPAAVGEGMLETRTTPVPAPADSMPTDAVTRAAGHYLTLGDRAFRDGRYGDAVHFYAKAIEYSPNDGVMHLILSDALFATGDYHYAAYALRRALELDPRLVEATADKHTFYSDPTTFDTQLMLLERYVQDHFVDDDARLLLAANYLFGGRPDASIEILESPFSVDVKESDAGRMLLERARALAQSAPAQKR
jgi:hypothetical protein